MNEKFFKFFLKLYAYCATFFGFIFCIAAVGSMEAQTITDFQGFLYGIGGLLISFSGTILLNILYRK